MKGTTEVIWLCRIRGDMVSVCLITGDITFDHVVKIVSSGFLHCKITIFFLCN